MQMRQPSEKDASKAKVFHNFQVSLNRIRRIVPLDT